MCRRPNAPRVADEAPPPPSDDEEGDEAQSDGERSQSPTLDYDCDFDLPLMIATASAAATESAASRSGRSSFAAGAAAPPLAPIFTASSITWNDEDRATDDEEAGESSILEDDYRARHPAETFVFGDPRDMAATMLFNNADSGCFVHESDEIEGNVDVGATLCLVDRAAARDSDATTTTDDSEFYSDEDEASEVEGDLAACATRQSQISVLRGRRRVQRGRRRGERAHFSPRLIEAYLLLGERRRSQHSLVVAVGCCRRCSDRLDLGCRLESRD